MWISIFWKVKPPWAASASPVSRQPPPHSPTPFSPQPANASGNCLFGIRPRRSCEALWMQALDEGRRRAHQELNRAERVAADHQQNLEVRSHVLTLRDRDRTIDDLSLRLRELTTMLRKEQ